MKKKTLKEASKKAAVEPIEKAKASRDEPTDGGRPKTSDESKEKDPSKLDNLGPKKVVTMHWVKGWGSHNGMCTVVMSEREYMFYASKGGEELMKYACSISGSCKLDYNQFKNNPTWSLTIVAVYDMPRDVTIKI